MIHLRMIDLMVDYSTVPIWVNHLTQSHYCGPLGLYLDPNTPCTSLPFPFIAPSLTFLSLYPPLATPILTLEVCRDMYCIVKVRTRWTIQPWEVCLPIWHTSWKRTKAPFGELLFIHVASECRGLTWDFSTACKGGLVLSGTNKKPGDLFITVWQRHPVFVICLDVRFGHGGLCNRNKLATYIVDNLKILVKFTQTAFDS